MLKITLDFHEQMKVINNFMPKLRSKMTGEYFKLYCDTHDQYHELLDFLKKVQYEFYSIKLKSERPIKVVIKGLPKKAKTEDMHSDLIDLGFTVDRVSQLTGKITNQLLPVFLVTLPRNMINATIFKLDKLSYLNVTVEGYDSKGVTQCYKCQQFNHTASNCHIKPECLKCGEPHQTSDCLIYKVETMYCVNCETYGHMANYSKCPLYPKPRKGATIKPNYPSIVNSLVRPNVSFAQAAQQERNKIIAPTPQQMAPRNGQVPATTPTQTQAAITHVSKQPLNNNAKNECMGLITQTLSQTIQALSLLVQQINSLDFSSNTPQPSSNNKNKTQRKKEIRALVEALLDDYDDYTPNKRPEFVFVERKRPSKQNIRTKNFHREVRPRHLTNSRNTSDKNLFTADIEALIQTNSNCVIFGDFNATHSAWNCSKNSPRGIRLKDFADDNNLEIAFPNSPTRYGYNSSNTLDFALISNFNYPYNIVSITDLSSDRNPVMLNFNITTSIHKDNPRAITTCWFAFRNNLKKEIRLFDFAKINNESSLEEKVAKFADAISSAHNLASKPIKNNRHNYTPQHINYWITCKNRARKLYQQTLNPIHKTEANRLQKLIKKEIRVHSQNTGNAKLESLETQDNSLWQMQKYFRKKRSDIPNLTGPNGIASNDEQKANLIANTFIDNYTENKRPWKHTTNIDSDVTNTLTRFFSTPLSSPISPTDPDEICEYVKKLKNSKAPGIDNITNKMIKNFPFKIILIFTLLHHK
ncbi:probable RNA-directed DNA polymerase from transposon BS [Trichonephila clavipes]|nr:probable RNA-directed DNA polymerase from transposon BS [Trichonephila clavipes]